MLNNSLYQTIMRDYNRRQAEAKHEQDLRTQEIFTKFPEYEVLEQEIITLCAGEARARVLNPKGNEKNASKELHDRITRLKTRQLDLLQDAGYPEDYLELHYTCPLCKDTGFSDGDLCRCFRQAAARLIYDQTKITSLLEKENFGTFRIDYYSETVDPRFGISPAENMRMIAARCQQYIKNFDTHFTNLFIYGETGVGKSF